MVYRVCLKTQVEVEVGVAIVYIDCDRYVHDKFYLRLIDNDQEVGRLPHSNVGAVFPKKED